MVCLLRLMTKLSSVAVQKCRICGGALCQHLRGLLFMCYKQPKRASLQYPKKPDTDHMLIFVFIYLKNRKIKAKICKATSISAKCTGDISFKDSSNKEK